MKSVAEFSFFSFWIDAVSVTGVYLADSHVNKSLVSEKYVMVELCFNSSLLPRSNKEGSSSYHMCLGGRAQWRSTGFSRWATAVYLFESN